MLHRFESLAIILGSLSWFLTELALVGDAEPLPLGCSREQCTGLFKFSLVLGKKSTFID